MHYHQKQGRKFYIVIKEKSAKNIENYYLKEYNGYDSVVCLTGAIYKFETEESHMKQMKRILSFVLALTMLVSMFSVAVFSTSAEETTYVLGDADMDGIVNIFDVTYIQRSLAKHEGYEIEEGTIEFAAADADGDGIINIFDVTYIQRYLAKYDDGYGIGETKTFGGGDVDPTKPTEDESVEGYYLVGKLNGVEYWDASTLTADRKLKDADGDGIYTLDWTFYMGDELKVVQYDGTSITRWYKDGTDPDGDKNYSIGSESKTGLCTLSFDPTGSQGWSYIYFTVQQKAVDETVPETEPTENEATGDQPTQATEATQATEEKTEAPVGGPGYYLVGALNGVQMWSVDANSADRKLSGPDEKGIYTLDWTFYMNDQVKVAYYDGTSITEWFKDGMDNHYSIGDEKKTGLCTLSFDPTASQGWSYGYLTVQKKVVEETEVPTAEPTVAETEAETEEPTQGEATDDDPTVAETEEPTVVETEAQTEAPKADEGYYLVGTLNTVNCWFVDDTAVDRKLIDADGDGIYTLDWTFYDKDEIKVVKYDGTTITRWYKGSEDGDNPNYTLTEAGGKTGLCTVSFDPTGSQGWSYKYFTVKQKEVVETEAPTAEPTVAETEAETEAPTQAEATEDEETVAPTEEETKAEATDDDPTVAETEAPVVIPAGYYLVGTLGGEDCWTVDENSADRMFTANAENEGEYMLDWTFVDGDEIKVVYFNGTEIERWFKDGSEMTEDDKQDDGTYNNNYKISAVKAGEKTMYFRPEGNADWSYKYFTVPSTVAPVDYYLFGYINGANYACEEDNANLGEYKFVDGKLTAKFDSTSYVAVKTGDNKGWYMTNGWLGEVNTATLFNTSVTGENSNKLFVPGGVEYTFTLVDNGDDTFTLSYEEAQVETEAETEAPTAEPTEEPTVAETEAPTAEPTEEPTVAETEAETEEPTQGEATPDDPTVEETEAPTAEPTDPPVVIPAGYYLVGTLNGEDCWTVDENSADRMFTANAENEGEYMLDWTFVEGDEIKVVYFNGTEIEKWFKDGSEITEDDKQDDGTYNNNYKISAVKAGEKTMYFRPEGNADWSYKYFTVPSTVAPVDYHLVGYINGADYGIEGDSANIGEYKFVDGKLVATFSATSYVFVKTSDNANWYMTNGWAGEVSSVTLYNTNNIGTDANKLYVPGGVEVTFTLVDNGDDTFTLSYTTPQAPTEETLPEGGGSDVTDPTEDVADLEAGYYLVGNLNGKDCWDVSTLSSDRLLTDADGDGVYTLQWTFYMGDKTKVAYFDGTSITKLFKPDGQPTYDIGSSSKTGLRTLSFQPNGTSSYSYTYFTIK